MLLTLTPLTAFAANPPVDINGVHSGSAYGNSNDAGVTDNLSPVESTLNINNGGSTGGSAYGGYNHEGSNYGGSNIDANGNVVNVYAGGSVGDDVYGGLSEGSYCTATGNTANFAGSAGLSVYGGYAFFDATGNTAIISGGSVGDDVYGGMSSQGKATGNIVSITGGLVNGGVYGGYAAYLSISGGPATGNTVTISGSPTLSGTIYGGYALSHDSFTGNTLNKDSDVTIVAAQNFEFVNFGYAGNANIGTLDTTPTRATGNPPVALNTNANTITFGGSITGTGGIEKTGTGTLTLSGTNTYTGMTTVSAGTLNTAAPCPAALTSATRLRTLP
jgi:autotransporter-associated beta strand protein